VSSVHILALLLRIVLLVTLVLARERVNINWAVRKITATGSTCKGQGQGQGFRGKCRLEHITKEGNCRLPERTGSICRSAALVP
jgi:hypothetical protein